jgi:signal transduction histidine kinase/CheY-like chemotaxis protein
MALNRQPSLVRVLVVEDNEDDFRYLRYLLQQINTSTRYEADWASSFEAGLAALRRREHDVGLFDYQLGARTGMDLLRESRSMECEIPIILLTGADNSAVDEEAAASGAADYLSKVKLDAIHLERSIRYSLRHAQMVTALRESQAQLQLFMRNVPCAVCIEDQRGEILFRNELFQQQFPPELITAARQQSGGNTTWQFDAASRHWLVSAFPMVDAAGRQLRGFAAIDITARIQAEEALRRTTWLLNGILTTLPVVASRIDDKGVVGEYRGQGLASIGLKDGDLVGANVSEVYPHAAAEIRKALEGGAVNFLSSTEHDGRTHYFDNYFYFDEARGSGAIGFSVNVTARIEAQAVSRRQSQLLTGIMSNMPVIVGRLDANGRVIEVEGEGLAPRGLIAEKLVGRVFAKLYRQAREAIEQANAGDAASFSLTGHDGDEEWQVEFYVFPDANDQGAIFFGRDITEQKRLEKRLLGITDAEQRRIGADLHDGLGQQLTGIACLATALRDRLKKETSKQVPLADNIAELANAAIEYTRGLARGLCPVQVEQSGLAAALEDLAYQIQRMDGPKCQFVAIGPPPPLEPDAALHLYRIAQEALNNAVRHSGATRIIMTLDSASVPPKLSIEDNGHGFDPNALPSGHGLGLRLMEYRAAMIGGSFKITPRPRGGMRAECTLSNSNVQYETQSLARET